MISIQGYFYLTIFLVLVLLFLLFLLTYVTVKYVLEKRRNKQEVYNKKRGGVRWT